MSIPLSLTEDELKAAIDLFDAAVRHHGLTVAENAIHLTRILRAAYEASRRPPTEEETST